jgi:hypothetical protein
VVEGRGVGKPRPRGGRHGEATRRRCGAWGGPLGPREHAAHDPQALTAVRTELTGLERGRLAGGRLTLPVSGLEGCGRFVARQAELEVVEERTREGTPEPIRADFVEPLGQDMRQKAPDDFVGG